MDAQTTFPYFAGLKVLYVHGFASSGASHTAALLQQKLPKATVLHPDLPLEPADMMPFLRNYCAAHRPDLIVGTSMGGMLTEKLRGFDRICVNPALHIDQSIGTTLRYGDMPMLAPRADGIATVSVTKALAKAFAPVCADNFAGLDEADAHRCVGLFGTEDTTVDCRAEFAAHYPYAIPFVGGHRLNDHTLLHAVMPVVRRFDRWSSGRELPAVFLHIDTLRRDGGALVSDARAAVEMLCRHFETYVVAPPEASCDAWVLDQFGVDLWHRVVTTAHMGTLLGDYLVTPCERHAGQFAGTTLLFGSPTFKTWTLTQDYFSHLLPSPAEMA